MAMVLDDFRERQNGLDRLLAGYRPLPGVFDEMMEGDGRPRPHWLPLLSMLATLRAPSGLGR